MSRFPCTACVQSRLSFFALMFSTLSRLANVSYCLIHNSELYHRLHIIRMLFVAGTVWTRSWTNSVSIQGRAFNGSYRGLYDNLFRDFEPAAAECSCFQLWIQKHTAVINILQLLMMLNNINTVIISHCHAMHIGLFGLKTPFIESRTQGLQKWPNSEEIQVDASSIVLNQVNEMARWYHTGEIDIRLHTVRCPHCATATTGSAACVGFVPGHLVRCFQCGT